MADGSSTEIPLVRTKPYGQKQAMVAAAFIVNLGFRCISVHPVRFSGVAVLELAVVAGYLEEIGGSCSSTVNRCLWLRGDPEQCQGCTLQGSMRLRARGWDV